MKLTSSKISKLSRLLALACAGSCLMLTGCFTGVESTKKINLSRDDRKLIALSDEDTLMNAVRPQPLGEWLPGKRFLISDGRISLLFDRYGTTISPTDTASLAGDTLVYEGRDVRRLPDGGSETILMMRHGGQIFRYPSGKTPEAALSAVSSGELPMLIDLDMVSKADSLLRGRQLWIRTDLWYDMGGNRISGRKFVPVKVLGVVPGSMVFPLRLTLEDDRGKRFMQLMNMGSGANESRSFARLFRLTDPHLSYPSISDENWALIQSGRVREGMTKEECRLALGNPSFTDSGRDYSSTLDIWRYDDGTFLRFRDGLLVNE